MARLGAAVATVAVAKELIAVVSRSAAVARAVGAAGARAVVAAVVIAAESTRQKERQQVQRQQHLQQRVHQMEKEWVEKEKQTSCSWIWRTTASAVVTLPQIMPRVTSVAAH